MAPASGTASLHSSSSQSRKSISSVFGSVFKSKGGQINGFRIELVDPHRKYGPGSTVKGKVVLDVTRPLGVTHIIVCLYGFLQVFKNHKSARNGHRNPSGRVVTGGGKRWVTEYHGDGYAELFEEEVVLCGTGRLDPNLYHFEFEIQFPTNIRLPSSIEFGRGTISYIVTASITRPNTIAFPSTCERSVEYRDDIDIGPLPIPRTRAITLEAESRRSKARYPMNRLTSSDSKRKSQTFAASPSDRSSQTVRTSASIDAPGSLPPSPSADSSLSSLSDRRRPHGAPSETRSSQTSQSPNTEPERRKQIAASVRLAKAGCLAGDRVPVHVTISYHKPIGSIRSVIVTLYRQARVDMHPNLPLKSTDGGEEKYEDYYPRSKTGLGGLSLSAAGSSQEWRKDLSQTVSAFYINPHTLEAEINADVRVPDDTFPTIRNAPGDMISFKYFVEVIIDVNGKLASQETGFANLGLVGAQSSYVTTTGGPINNVDQSVVAYGPNCIDTSRIRREKNAIVCICDLVVGTTNSSRNKGKRRMSTNLGSQRQAQAVQASRREEGTREHHQSEQAYHVGRDHAYTNGDGQYDREWEQYLNEQAWEQYMNQQGHANGYDYGDYYTHFHDTGPVASQAPDIIPPPMATFDENLSEKERARLAEERLLPSQPPGLSAASGSSAPTAPTSEQLSGHPRDEQLRDSQPVASASASNSSGVPGANPTAGPSPKAQGKDRPEAEFSALASAHRALEMQAHEHDGSDAEPTAPGLAEVEDLYEEAPTDEAESETDIGVDNHLPRDTS